MNLQKLINRKASQKDYDEFAWFAICNWHISVGFNPIINGLDYNHLIRFYLWDKVGRSIRRLISKTSYNLEYDLYSNEIKDPKLQFYLYSQDNFLYEKKTFEKIKKQIKRNFPKKFRKKEIFFPVNNPKNTQIIKELSKTNQCILLIKNKQLANLPNTELIESKQFYFQQNNLFENVISGLKEFGIELIEEDHLVLKKQLELLNINIQKADYELLKNKPAAVFVHTDNHPPYLIYVLLAKKYHISSYTYQHGLDCERFYLQDAYVDYYAVWSDIRKQEFEHFSEFKPLQIKTIGSPFIPIKDEFDKEKQILWLTRPHSSIKCYSPSRKPIEALRIFKALMQFLVSNPDYQLIIRKHPMDSDLLYPIVEYSTLHDRIKIENETALHEQIISSSIILTEDTTAGVEAFFYNNKVVYVNFSHTEPILPLAKYNSVFSALNSEELISILNLVKDSNISKEMIKQQKQFVNDYFSSNEDYLANLVGFLLNNEQ